MYKILRIYIELYDNLIFEICLKRMGVNKTVNIIIVHYSFDNIIYHQSLPKKRIWPGFFCFNIDF